MKYNSDIGEKFQLVLPQQYHDKVLRRLHDEGQLIKELCKMAGIDKPQVIIVWVMGVQRDLIKLY